MDILKISVSGSPSTPHSAIAPLWIDHGTHHKRPLSESSSSQSVLKFPKAGLNRTRSYSD
eukprot:1876407-Amphidinium_carterae.1